MAKDTPPANSTRTLPLAIDPQRDLLQQLTVLCIESAKEEERLATDLDQRVSQHRHGIEQARATNEENRRRNLAAIEAKRAERLARIESRHHQELAALKQQTTQARRLAEEQKATVDDQTRKQNEQARWLAESVLEAIETQLEVESRQGSQLHTSRLAELDQQQNTQLALLARLEQPQIPF